MKNSDLVSSSKQLKFTLRDTYTPNFKTPRSPTNKPISSPYVSYSSNEHRAKVVPNLAISRHTLGLISMPSEKALNSKNSNPKSARLLTNYSDYDTTAGSLMYSPKSGMLSNSSRVILTEPNEQESPSRMVRKLKAARPESTKPILSKNVVPIMVVDVPDDDRPIIIDEISRFSETGNKLEEFNSMKVRMQNLTIAYQKEKMNSEALLTGLEECRAQNKVLRKKITMLESYIDAKPGRYVHKGEQAEKNKNEKNQQKLLEYAELIDFLKEDNNSLNQKLTEKNQKIEFLNSNFEVYKKKMTMQFNLFQEEKQKMQAEIKAKNERLSKLLNIKNHEVEGAQDKMEELIDRLNETEKELSRCKKLLADAQMMKENENEKMAEKLNAYKMKLEMAASMTKNSPRKIEEPTLKTVK